MPVTEHLEFFGNIQPTESHPKLEIGFDDEVYALFRTYSEFLDNQSGKNKEELFTELKKIVDHFCDEALDRISNTCV